jgi:hypothetical protein
MASSDALSSTTLTVATATGLVATTAIATTLLLALSGQLLWPRWPRVMASPLRTRLRTKIDESLVYTPDQFPGARDVQTPVCLLLPPYDCHPTSIARKIWNPSLTHVAPFYFSTAPSAPTSLAP